MGLHGETKLYQGPWNFLVHRSLIWNEISSSLLVWILNCNQSEVLIGCNNQFIFLASHTNKSQIILWVKISNLKSCHSEALVIEYDLMAIATYS